MADRTPGDPPRAFVIGWPISHSLSPDLHNFWLRKYNIQGSYEKIAVRPDELEEFLTSLPQSNFVGGNVTLPHKESVFTKTAHPNPIASRLEAVNTLWFEDGLLHSGNTDSYGFTANLNNHAPDWRNSVTATLIGAGGAAKAIILALQNAGIIKINIVNRTLARAQLLAEKFSPGCYFHETASLAKLLPRTDLLINTTSLGMTGQPKLDIDLHLLPASAIVADIVYNPLETPLLARAKSLNLVTVDGIGMLLHQAVPGFEKWFGLRPQVTEELRNFILQQMSAGER